MILILGILMERIRLPMVLGVLLAGALMGPQSPLAGIQLGPLNLGALVINSPDTVALFALFGSVLILFGIGLEFSLVKLFRLGFSTFLAALIKLGITYIIGHIVSRAMGFDTTASVLLGLMLSFSSTPIIIKILEGQGKLKRVETPFIMAVLIIEDLVAVALLGIMATSGFGDQYAIAIALLKVVITFAIAYFALSKAIRYLLSIVQHSDEFLVLFTVSIVLVISYVCQSIGIGFSVGSFLAGSIVATTPQAKRISDMIRPFNTLFASFFFFSIGMMVDVNSTMTGLPLLFGFLLVAAVGKFVSSVASAYLIGLPGPSSAFAASALLPLGELSLLIGSMAVAAHLIPAGILGLLASLIVITSILSVIMVSQETRVYHFCKDITPEFVSRHMGFLRTTSLGVQRVVEENSRYSRIVNRLPSIGGTGAYSTNEQLSMSIRRIFVFAFLSGVLFLVLYLSSGPWKDLIGTLRSFAFLGFYACATLFVLSASSAFRIYLQILRHSGRSSLHVAINILGSLFFILIAAACAGAALVLSDINYLMLLVPVVLLGSKHFGEMFAQLRRAFMSGL